MILLFTVFRAVGVGAGGAEAGRGVLVRTYPAAPGVYGWGLSVDAFLLGDRHRLLTLTFTARHE